ncbi:CLUMA_CG011883, isoform A [Clunio marinus]|uniref:CLUMA_CG011883, isoform A n=1 Tax=Clunio marinus TaxID=568069 RepID=A0A1J1IFJ7_9DIPT|nr:CLUMA_CG011883, isoform A [Clunio marinus]
MLNMGEAVVKHLLTLTRCSCCRYAFICVMSLNGDLHLTFTRNLMTSFQLNIHNVNIDEHELKGKVRKAEEERYSNSNFNCTRFYVELFHPLQLHSIPKPHFAEW